MPKRWPITPDLGSRICLLQLRFWVAGGKADQGIASNIPATSRKWYLPVTFAVNAVSDRWNIIAALQCHHVGSKVIDLIRVDSKVHHGREIV